MGRRIVRQRWIIELEGADLDIDVTADTLALIFDEALDYEVVNIELDDEYYKRSKK